MKAEDTQEELRKFDYVIYLEVSDRIEVHIAAERSIFNRGSESSAGGEGIILKQVETHMPYSIQKKIFERINSKLLENNFEQKK